MIGHDYGLSPHQLALLAILPVIYATGFLHELGHAVMARLCGFRITSFGLGLGGRCLAFGVGGTRVYLTASRPFQGLTFTFAPQLFPSRWAHAAMLAGGVIANGLIAAACFALWSNSVPGSEIWAVAALINAGALINVLPLKVRVGVMTLRSDGAQILDLFRGRLTTPAPLVIQNAEALRPHFVAVGDRVALRVNLACAALSCQELGLSERASATLAEAEAVEIPDPPEVLTAYEAVIRATMARMGGRFGEAEVESEAAESGFRGQGHEIGLLLASVLRAELRAVTGDLAGALAELERLSAHPLLASRASLRASFLAARLTILSSLDDAEGLDQVRREYEQARRHAPSDAREAGVQLALARRAGRRGDLKEAADAYEGMLKARVALAKMWASPDDAKSYLDAQQPYLAEAEAGLAQVGRSLQDVVPELRADVTELAKAREEAHKRQDQRLQKAGLRLFLANVLIAATLVVLVLADRAAFFQRTTIHSANPFAAPHFLGMLLAAVLLALTAFGGVSVLVVGLLGRSSPSLVRNFGKMTLFWAAFPWMILGGILLGGVIGLLRR